MPYLKRDDRIRVAGSEVADSPGELNFLLTEVVKRYCLRHGINYRVINDVMGALESAKQEFYRRIAAPYEDRKLASNGDVYLVLLNELERANGNGHA